MLPRIGKKEQNSTPASAKKETTIRVARSMSDLMQVVAIRAAVYLSEQSCPYDEEFDGNDFCAMHLIGAVGGQIYGHAQDRLVPFWSRFGARPVEPRRPLVFSDFSYTEMLLETEPLPEALSLESDPYVLIRPEGLWDEPGPLEASAARPVTSPVRNNARAA
jgi:hypothetical protein